MRPDTPYQAPNRVPAWAKARRVWEQAQVRGRRATPEHVGAWLDRMLDEPITAGEREQKHKHADRIWLYHDAVEALRLGSDPGQDPAAVQTWRGLYARHAATFGEADPSVRRHVVVIETCTRVLLHAATERTVTEGGVLLHHTYGVPYLPGSALKGALRGALSGRRKRFDLSKLLTDENVDAVAVLFGKANTGTEDHAGLIDVIDALWIPERPATARGAWSPLSLDVVTPHHPQAEREAPTDQDAPVPTHRLTLAPGCRFRVVLEAPPGFPAAWLRWLGDEVLPAALSQDGLGAWTSAGYGRFRDVAPAPVGCDGGGGAVRAPSLSPSQPVKQTPQAPAVWLAAELTFRANTGELSAILADRRQARAAGASARALLAALPPGAVEQLRGNRPIRVEVQVEALGRAWALTAARARPEG